MGDIIAAIPPKRLVEGSLIFSALAGMMVTVLPPWPLSMIYPLFAPFAVYWSVFSFAELLLALHATGGSKVMLIAVSLSGQGVSHHLGKALHDDCLNMGGDSLLGFVLFTVSATCLVLIRTFVMPRY